jgi:subtilisin family serine protease
MIRMLACLCVAAVIAAAPAPAAPLDGWRGGTVLSSRTVAPKPGVTVRESLVRPAGTGARPVRVEEVETRAADGSRRVSRTETIAGEILVEAGSRTAATALARAAGLTVAKAVDGRTFVLAAPPSLDAAATAIARIRAAGFKGAIGQNFVDRPASPPNDPLYGQQWTLANAGQYVDYLKKNGTPGADIDWQVAWDWLNPTGKPKRDTTPVTVAIIDSGRDITNADLSSRVWMNGPELVGKAGFDDDGNGYFDDVLPPLFAGYSVNDDFGHGTAHAAIVGAIQGNGLGTAGVARNVRLMVVKVYTGSYGDSASTLAGINYAIASGADVISIGLGMSYLAGDPAKSTTTLSAIKAMEKAKAKDILVVIPAGNGNADGAAYTAPFPKHLDNIIRVAATDNQDLLAHFPGYWGSSYGMDSVHIAAPSMVVTPWAGGKTWTFDGTSAAAPHVAGVAAMLRSIDPLKSYAGIRKAIFDGADRLPSLAGKTMVGDWKTVGSVAKMTSGARLNAWGAIQALLLLPPGG